MKILITALAGAALLTSMAATEFHASSDTPQGSDKQRQHKLHKQKKGGRVNMRVVQVDDVLVQHRAKNKRYTPFFKVPSLHTGIYTLPKGGEDGQSPHREDEVYYVLAGKAKMLSDGRKEPVRKGSMIFIAAGVAHKFVEIEADLELLVLFSSGKPQGPGHVKKAGKPARKPGGGR